MSKRDILRAASRKGIEFEELEYDRQVVTPGEIVSAWIIQLTEESEDRISALEAGHNLNPDLWNTRMVLDWIDSLPDISTAAAQEGK